VRSWLHALPSGAATSVEQDLEHEHVIQIRPARQQAAPVEIRVSDYGTFGLYVSSLQVEDLPVVRLAEVLDAIRNGGVEEEIWTRRGRVQRRRTVLRLRSGDLWGKEDLTASAAFGLWLGKSTHRSFAPYS